MITILLFHTRSLQVILLPITAIITLSRHFFNKHFRYLPLICRRTKAAVYKTQTASYLRFAYAKSD
jgi:hypothetical protein